MIKLKHLNETFEHSNNKGQYPENLKQVVQSEVKRSGLQSYTVSYKKNYY